MKKVLLLLIILILSIQNTYAYSITQVSEHNTQSDCWVVFDNNVYDLTGYLRYHDRYLDIRTWCGMDMTQDFITKAGMDRDHMDSSYQLLESYLIGSIDSVESDNEVVTSNEETVVEVSVGSEYNLIIPLLLSLSLYWVPYVLIKKDIIKSSLKGFNGFWNTILLSLLLIPALGFGIFMILRYKVQSLWDIDFDFMYWHVELSLLMGFIGLSHFLQRIQIYFLQLKKST